MPQIWCIKPEMHTTTDVFCWASIEWDTSIDYGISNDYFLIIFRILCLLEVGERIFKIFPVGIRFYLTPPLEPVSPPFRSKIVICISYTSWVSKGIIYVLAIYARAKEGGGITTPEMFRGEVLHPPWFKKLFASIHVYQSFVTCCGKLWFSY